MINIIQKPEIKISYEGKYNRLETYKPVIRRQAEQFVNKIDHFFVNGQWPK